MVVIETIIASLVHNAAAAATVITMTADVFCCLKLLHNMIHKNSEWWSIHFILLSIAHLHYQHSLLSYLKNGGKKCPPNVRIYLPTYIASHSRRVILAHGC
jgi:hypothetical protein